MKNFIKKHKGLIIGSLIFFALSFLFPYTGDDLEWSLVELSPSSFLNVITDATLNGRYLGNLFAMIMTKNVLIRGLIMTIVVSGIVYLIKEETKAPYSIIWFLLLTMPVLMLSQSIVWTSGFVNYTISTMLLLIMLRTFKKQFKDDRGITSSLGFMLLTFISSFFIENMTIFILILGITLNIIYFIKNKKLNIALMGALLGSAVGTLLMFMNPAYYNVLTGSDNYRTYGVGVIGLIKRFCGNFTSSIHTYVILKNVVLITLLNLLLMYYHKKNQKSYKDNKNRVLKITFYISFAYTILFILLRVNNALEKMTIYHDYITAVLTLPYMVILIFQIFVLFYQKKNFIKIILPLLIIIGLIGPLCVVSPIGPRNFFMIYVLEMVELFYIFNETDLKYETFNSYILIIAGIMTIYYFIIYGYNYLVYIQKDEYVKYISSNTKETLCSVPEFPFKDYIHSSKYDSKYQIDLYKRKLKLRDDLEFHYVDYKTWKKISKEHFIK